MKRLLTTVAATLLVASSQAGLLGQDAPRQEIDVEPPGQFDLNTAEAFEMPGDQRLRYAVVPETLQIGDDGLLRYVLVATSSGGGQNVLFEALDCKRGEHKTLARWSSYQKRWTPVQTPNWEALSEARSVASQVLANGIFCHNNLVLGSREQMLRELKRQ